MAFDYNKLNELKTLFKKAQFVPMDPSMAAPPPDAGAGAPPPDGGAGAPPPDAGAMPPDAGAMPPDAGAMPPMDPSMMAPPPMPPAPPPADPAAGGSMVSMPTDEFLKFLKQIIGLIDKHNEGVQAQQPAPNPAFPAGSSDPQLAEVNAKLDAILRG